ncbi:replication initiation protein RepM [Acinetobacter sp. BY419]|uniref:replication initiation protein RepM n=1 Tax=Acinetobacter sp. BY419 TaxID=2820675 RepID=UPI001C21DDED|nr:replication initiation protein RepM [Acinetobacter sp. BY419]
MAEKYVVKDNDLVKACFNLGLNEYRLLLLAMIYARESDPLTFETPIEITATAFARQYELEANTAYEAMQDASKTLMRRTYSYQDRYKGYEAITDVAWVTQATYIPTAGMLVLYLTPQTIKLISRLETHFTKYHIDQVSKFKSKYSIRLYELVIKWKNQKKTEKFEINNFREMLGVINEYKQMSDFKINVLDKAVKEINAHSDITVKYEQFKKGRVISDFQFKITLKKKSIEKKSVQADQDTGDLFVQLSAKQRHLFAQKLSEHPDMSKYSQGTESYPQFAIRIAEMLLDEQKFKELYPILLKVGYVPKS